MVTRKGKTKTVKDVEAEMARKEAAMAGDATGHTVSTGQVAMTDDAADRSAAKRTPSVLSGTVVAESVDPNAERALKDKGVAADYRAAKSLFLELKELEGERVAKLRAIADKLMDLRAHFKEPGSRGKRIDWNGISQDYKAVATLLYRDVGIDGEEHASTQRSVRYQVENVKRERVPKKDWDHYGVQALTRGQRQALASKFGKNLDSLKTAADETGKSAATGQVTGAQLVTLAKQIDRGISVYSQAPLQALTPKQRQTFRDQLQHTRERTEAILRELDGLED